MSARWSFVTAFALFACSSPSESSKPAALSPTPFEPASKCGPGKAARADQSCFEVGPAAPTGLAERLFARSADGWGFTGIAAPSCADADRAELGSERCVVDDCDAPFPPPGADVVVSSRAVDVRSVQSIAQALERVKAGGVIAVDEGTYPPVNVDKDVTIVGKCARETRIGNGKNNALYVSGAKVTVRGVTLFGSSSPVAVQTGSVVAERVIVSDSNVGLGAIGAGSTITLRHSVIEGLGTGKSSLGAMAGQGGKVVLEDSELRGVSNGVMATDTGSRVELRRSIVRLAAGPETAVGLAANSGGHIEVEASHVRAESGRLAAAHMDKGTSGGAVARVGTMVIRSSVLEQGGSEHDNAAISVHEGGKLELTDVTLRHQSVTGILSSGELLLKGVVILGDEHEAKSRAGIMTAGSRRPAVEAEGLAIPWAQGLGIMIGGGGTLQLRDSLVSNVAARGRSGQSALLASDKAKVELDNCELAGNERTAIALIGESSLTATNLYVHDTLPGTADPPEGFGLLALHGTVRLGQSTFERNAEAVVAAGSSIAAQTTTFLRHRIAVRAMDGMKVVEDSSELEPNAVSLAGCTFQENEARTSSETLPQLNAPPFDGESRK